MTYQKNDFTKKNLRKFRFPMPFARTRKFCNVHDITLSDRGNTRKQNTHRQTKKGDRVHNRTKCCCKTSMKSPENLKLVSRELTLLMNH